MSQNPYSVAQNPIWCILYKWEHLQGTSVRSSTLPLPPKKHSIFSLKYLMLGMKEHRIIIFSQHFHCLNVYKSSLGKYEVENIVPS